MVKKHTIRFLLGGAIVGSGLVAIALNSSVEHRYFFRADPPVFASEGWKMSHSVAAVIARDNPAYVRPQGGISKGEKRLFAADIREAGGVISVIYFTVKSSRFFGPSPGQIREDLLAASRKWAANLGDLAEFTALREADSKKIIRSDRSLIGKRMRVEPLDDFAGQELLNAEMATVSAMDERAILGRK